ncbi:hypothetical protein AYI70_g3972 [Smittium culicis]|uniref:Uncharacterized protein n=1 Tax=Smittium culicis TaxID=133412 RepID=A0A1R1Y146_9FUNG|nr:hypothetical protein AYI70_g3972 [Smittium culicis]
MKSSLRLTILVALLLSVSVFCNENKNFGLRNQKRHPGLRNKRGFYVAVSNGESSIDDKDYSEKVNIIDEFQDESNKPDPIQDNDDTPRKTIPEVKVPIFQKSAPEKLPRGPSVGLRGLPPKYDVEARCAKCQPYKFKFFRNPNKKRLIMSSDLTPGLCYYTGGYRSFTFKGLNEGYASIFKTINCSGDSKNLTLVGNKIQLNLAAMRERPYYSIKFHNNCC